MELKRYWQIVWRHWPVVLAVPFLVGLGSLALFLTRPPTYTARAKVQIVLVPPQANTADPEFRYDEYYNYLSTEYASDDLIEQLNGNVFAAAVGRTLRGPEYNLALRDEELRTAIEARRTHRVLLMEATGRSRDEARAIARAAAQTLRQDPLCYFSRGDCGAAPGRGVPLTIEEPVEARSDRRTGLLNVILQTALGLFAGLGLAFLLHYLDDRMHGEDAVREALGLPVLARIPAHGHVPNGLARVGRNGRAARGRGG